MIDITLQNFETEVIARSMNTPVLVDFWAPWCGPCKALGPVLEKLEDEYAGRFVLAKINSDEQQQLAGAFGVRSIPTVILMVGGQPVDGFAGALPEGQLRAFLDKHLPSEGELAAEAEADEADALLAQGDAEAALAKLQEALTLDPNNDDARHDLVKLLVSLGELDVADEVLAPALARIPVPQRFDALRQWVAALRFASTDSRGAWAPEQFDVVIAQNKRDFDTRFAKARVLMARGDMQAAMEELLEIIMRDKTWSDQAPRKTYVAILELLTPPRPKAAAEGASKSAGGIELSGKSAAAQDPQEALVSSYRRKLSMALN